MKYFILLVTFLSFIKCDCPTQTYELQNNVDCNHCYKPYNGCLTCPDESDCYVCIDGWFHETTAVNHCTACTQQWGKCNICGIQSCVQCAVGYGQHNVGICLQCQSQCLRCSYISGYKCYECSAGLRVDEETNECVLCEDNQCCYQGQNGCEKCSSSDFLLDENLQCQYNNISSDQKCKEQRLNSQNERYCYECIDGYYVNNSDGLCTICGVLDCEYCQDGTSCNKCYEGFFLQSQQCHKCSDNCHDCLSATQCYLCNPGYYSDADFQCQECTIPRCLHCSDNTECMECEEGYYLQMSDFTCQPCPLQCIHCREPVENQTQIECVECKEGFTLTTQYKCILESNATNDDEALNGQDFILVVGDDDDDDDGDNGQLLYFSVFIQIILMFIVSA